MDRRDLKHFLGLAALLTALLWPGVVTIGPHAAAAQAQGCGAPPEFVTASAPLTHVAAELQPGGALDVLAVGSLTLTNPDLLSPEGGFAYRMAAALRRWQPGAAVNLTVRGGKGLTAADMLELIHGELAGHHYQLVIWQTGAVDAMRKVPPTEFYRTLNQGAALASLAGANLLLVDTQYSRMVSGKVNLGPYQDALRRASGLPGVVLFRRYDLMRDWADSGLLDLERVGRAGREDAMGLLQSCLGDTLARLVLNGAKEAK